MRGILEKFLSWLFCPSVEDYMQTYRRLARTLTWKLIGKKKSAELMRQWEKEWEKERGIREVGR